MPGCDARCGRIKWTEAGNKFVLLIDGHRKILDLWDTFEDKIKIKPYKNVKK